MAAVEVKNREDLSPQVARTMRANLISHEMLPDVPYFLLVSQDTGYLWANAARSGREEPSLTFSMEDVVKRHAGALPAGKRLRGTELELLVFNWLGWLSELSQPPLQEPERSLAEAGFFQAVRGGYITREAA